jgi:hypothetical protein
MWISVHLIQIPNGFFLRHVFNSSFIWIDFINNVDKYLQVFLSFSHCIDRNFSSHIDLNSDSSVSTSEVVDLCQLCKGLDNTIGLHKKVENLQQLFSL